MLLFIYSVTQRENRSFESLFRSQIDIICCRVHGTLHNKRKMRSSNQELNTRQKLQRNLRKPFIIPHLKEVFFRYVCSCICTLSTGEGQGKNGSGDDTGVGSDLRSVTLTSLLSATDTY